MSFDPITMALCSAGGGLPVVEVGNLYDVVAGVPFTAEENAAFDAAAANAMPIILKSTVEGMPIALICSLMAEETGEPSYLTSIGVGTLMIIKEDGIWVASVTA